MTNPKHWHHFGCPAYVLDGALQGGAGIFHEWKECSKMGIHLGLLPQHARLVTLVLNLTTGLVSPQFHINFYRLRQPIGRSQAESGLRKDRQFQQAAGLDIPHSQETPPPTEGDRTSAVPPAEGNASTQSAASPPAGHVNGEPDYEVPASSSKSTGTRSSRRRRLPTQRLIEAYVATMAIALSTSSVEGEIFYTRRHVPEFARKAPNAGATRMCGFCQSQYNVPAQSNATAQQRAIPASDEPGGQRSAGKQELLHLSMVVSAGRSSGVAISLGNEAKATHRHKGCVQLEGKAQR